MSIVRRKQERAGWAAGWRLARALCALSHGRLRTEEGEALDGFYQGLRLFRTRDGQAVGFVNVSADCGGGSLHVFGRVHEINVDGGHQIIELNWKKPRVGADWPERTLAQAAGALGLDPSSHRYRNNAITVESGGQEEEIRS